MKPMTANALLAEEFVFSQCEINKHVLERDIEDIEDSELGAVHYTSLCLGSATVKSKSGLEIEFKWYGLGGNRCYTDAFRFRLFIDMKNPRFECWGAVLVNDDGVELEPEDTRKVFYRLLRRVPWRHSVERELPQSNANDLLRSQALDCYLVLRGDDHPGHPINFYGKVLASANNQFNRDQTDQLWTEMRLYKNRNDRYVCEHNVHAYDEEQESTYRGAELDTQDEVFAFFGDSILAKEIFHQAQLTSPFEVNDVKP